MPMKWTLNSSRLLWMALVCLATVQAMAAGTKSPATNGVAATRESVFVLPKGPKEGRDPFYPNSTRVADALAASAAASASSNPETEVTTLKCLGVSGTPGHLLAIINNHTFAVGDEGDVAVPGGKIHLRCLEIHPDVVVVEISGRVHRINLAAE
jgi:hypothetical protein